MGEHTSGLRAGCFSGGRTLFFYLQDKLESMQLVYGPFSCDNSLCISIISCQCEAKILLDTSFHFLYYERK